MLFQYSTAPAFRRRGQVLCYLQQSQLSEWLPAETSYLLYPRCSQSGLPSRREEVWNVRYQNMWLIFLHPPEKGSRYESNASGLRSPMQPFTVVVKNVTTETNSFVFPLRRWGRAEMTENSEAFQDATDKAADEQSITNAQPLTDHTSPFPIFHTIFKHCVD